jgi:putative ABC transport system permease protein
MTRVVLRRMGEIGILKAAGIRNREIFLVFAFEALIYGALGGVLGCLLGAVMMLFGPAPEVGEAMRAAAITIGLAVVVSAAAGAIPALRAMRASAVEAISYAW